MQIDAQDNLIEPIAPHDDFTFDQLSQSYNFQNVSARPRLFVRLLRKELERIGPSARVLDIGCGTGIGTGRNSYAYFRKVAELSDELWGVEPDTSVVPEHDWFFNHQHALLEYAELPEGYFDLAYSSLVMEHVADPVRFLEKVYRTLKPGGVYIFLTPNGSHHFAIIALTLNKLKLDELTLRLLLGKDKVDGYHYPVHYRCNRKKDLVRIAKQVGFSDIQIATVEIVGAKLYLRGPLRLFLWLMMKKRAVFKNPDVLLNLFARMRK